MATQVPASAAASTLAVAAAAGDCSWMNTLIEKLWPNISPAAHKMVSEMLPGIIDAYKPSWMEGIFVKKLDLGTVPFRVNNITVERDDDDEFVDIKMLVDVEWQSNADIEIEIKPLSSNLPRWLKEAATITGGIENIRFRAVALATMAPLIKVIPVVGAVQVCLREDPTVDFKLTLGTSQSGVLNSLRPLIDYILKHVVFATLTYPEHICVKLDNRVPDLCKPEGVLLATIVEAKNLPGTDWFSRADPYIECHVRSKLVKKTKVAKGANPTFEDTFHLLVHSRQYQKFVMRVLDQDVTSSDLVGYATLPLSGLQPGVELDTWVPVRTALEDDSEPLKDCAVHVKLTYACGTQPDLASQLRALDLGNQDVVMKAAESATPLLRAVLCGGVMKVSFQSVVAPSLQDLPLTARIVFRDQVQVVGVVRASEGVTAVKFTGGALFDVQASDNIGADHTVTLELAKGARGDPVVACGVLLSEVRRKTFESHKGVYGGVFDLKNSGFQLVAELWWFGIV